MIRSLLTTFFLGFSLTVAQAEEVLIERIVALVNDEPVLASELEAEIATVRRELEQRGVGIPPADELSSQVLERLVVQTLQLNVAEQRGIRVDSATLDATVRRVAQRNNLTLTELRDALASEGIDMATFRDQLRRDIVLNRLRQQEMRQRVDVTEQEIDQFLERNRDQTREYALAQILISTPEAASAEAIAEARAEAEAALQRLQSGESFAQLAAAVSDARNALEGGDLGWVPESQLPSLVAEQVPALEAGELTEILRSPAGFHIYRIDAVRDANQQLTEQARIRHILIETNAVVTDTDARLRLQSLRDRINAGVAFGDLARANSDDPTTATRGGELGWVDPANLPETFRESVEGLTAGAMSDPFRTTAGWHLAQVMDWRERDTSEQIAREQAAEVIRQRKAEEETELWLRELREEAYVELRLGGR